MYVSLSSFFSSSKHRWCNCNDMLCQHCKTPRPTSKSMKRPLTLAPRDGRMNRSLRGRGVLELVGLMTAPKDAPTPCMCCWVRLYQRLSRRLATASVSFCQTFRRSNLLVRNSDESRRRTTRQIGPAVATTCRSLTQEEYSRTLSQGTERKWLLGNSFDASSSRPPHSKKRSDVESLATLAVAPGTACSNLPPHRDDCRRRVGGVDAYLP